MTEQLERLVDSLLYEGYALYPYTPEATKNATPTPFGIVYPPAYAAHRPTATFDHIRLECLVVAAAGGAELAAEVRFLQPSGPRHQAGARRAALPPVPLDALAGTPVERDVAFASEPGPPLEVRVRLSAFPLDDGLRRVTLHVENRTQVSGDLDRAGALHHALLSTHPLLRLTAGRFVSPLEAAGRCESVNTWPVLATADDRALLGAAIVLPDHPQIAPESRGSLFDGTEIEEALLLHVQALSDEERAAIERQDPVVREMIARADAATPQELLALHGRVTVRDRVTSVPPTPSADVRDPTRGEDTAVVDGVSFRRGGKVVLRPGPDADLHARLLDGRTATVERIYVAVDGKVHLGVTVDDDPGQQLMRETGRFLFFFAPEVEAIP